MNWLAVALSLGRLQKKEVNKKAEWPAKKGREELLRMLFGARTVRMQVENKKTKQNQ